MSSLLVLADDLTGTLDTSVQFVEAISTVRVLLQTKVPVLADIVGVNSDTRNMDPLLVPSMLREIWNRHPARRLYLKIDSALRGHVALSIQSMLEINAAELAIIAPAFPARSRITVEGKQYVPGFSHQFESVDVLGRLRDEGLGIEHITLSEVRAGATSLRERLGRVEEPAAVVDAERDNDLAILARGIADWPAALPVGSAGFARAIAGEWFQTIGGIDLRRSSIKGPILFIVGSLHPVSHKQMNYLDSTGRAKVLELGRSTVVSKRVAEPTVSRLNREVQQVIREEQDVVLTPILRGDLQSELIEDTRIARLLIDVAANLLRHHAFETIVVTGGYTANQLCSRFDIKYLDVTTELAPGIVLAKPDSCSLGVSWLVTKAGSFGDDKALERIQKRLRKGE